VDLSILNNVALLL